MNNLTKGLLTDLETSLCDVKENTYKYLKQNDVLILTDLAENGGITNANVLEVLNESQQIQNLLKGLISNT